MQPVPPHHQRQQHGGSGQRQAGELVPDIELPQAAPGLLHDPLPRSGQSGAPAPSGHAPLPRRGSRAEAAGTGARLLVPLRRHLRHCRRLRPARTPPPHRRDAVNQRLIFSLSHSRACPFTGSPGSARSPANARLHCCRHAALALLGAIDSVQSRLDSGTRADPSERKNREGAAFVPTHRITVHGRDLKDYLVPSPWC